MYSERIQLLISKEQRRRLEQEARRRGTSVASVVREAVDAQFGPFSREDRIRAAEEIRRMRKGRFLSPEEINRLVAEEREREWAELGRQGRS